MALDDGIGARGIDQADLAQPFDRHVENAIVFGSRVFAHGFGIADDVDFVGGGGDALGEKFSTEQSVEKGCFACIKFAHHNQQKEFVQLGQAGFEKFKIILTRL